MELSAFILAYNEVDNIPALMESLKGIRDVVVLDNGSTDDTVKMFREAGARVYDGTKIGKYVATEEDAALFKERFGFEPGFTAGESFDNSGERRNHAASLCRNDWVVNPDCDERPEWDLKKLKPQLNGQGGLLHRYVHKHNPDGTTLIEFVQCKLYNRQKGEFTGYIHEVLVDRKLRKPVESQFSPDFVLHHWQKPSPHRDTHMKQLEYQAVKEETVRNLHYLAREYMDKGAPEKALAAYDRYFAIDAGDFPEQKSQAYLVQAESFRVLGRIDDAILACHKAMILDSSRRDPFFQLGMIYLERNDFRKALIWFNAANSISYNPGGYLNDMRLYTYAVHDRLSVCYQRLGKQDVAQMHWLEALKHLPENEEGARILANAKWIMKEPETGDMNMGK